MEYLGKVQLKRKEALESRASESARNESLNATRKSAAAIASVVKQESKQTRQQAQQLSKDIKSLGEQSKEVINWLEKLLTAVEKMPSSIDMSSVEIPSNIVLKNFPKFPEFPKSVDISNLSIIEEYFKPIAAAIDTLPKELVFDPSISIEPTPVNITQEKIDLNPLIAEIKKLQSKTVEIPETDITPLIKAVEKTTQSINNLKFPVANYVLPFKDEHGKATQVQLTDGGVPVVAQAQTQRYDVQGDIIYEAYAAVGTTDASSNWTITKYDLADITDASGKVAIGVAWVDRATEVYS